MERDQSKGIQIGMVTFATVEWTVKDPSTCAIVHRFQRPNNGGKGYRSDLESEITHLLFLNQRSSKLCDTSLQIIQYGMCRLDTVEILIQSDSHHASRCEFLPTSLGENA